MLKKEKPQTATGTKTEKPKFFGAKTEKPI